MRGVIVTLVMVFCLVAVRGPKVRVPSSFRQYVEGTTTDPCPCKPIATSGQKLLELFHFSWRAAPNSWIKLRIDKHPVLLRHEWSTYIQISACLWLPNWTKLLWECLLWIPLILGCASCLLGWSAVLPQRCYQIQYVVRFAQCFKAVRVVSCFLVVERNHRRALS